MVAVKFPTIKLVVAASPMKKFCLPLLATMVVSPLVAPAALAHQQQAAPIWLMKYATTSSETDQAKQVVKKLIEKHIQSVNQGDLQGFLQTLAPETAEYRNAAKSPSGITLFRDFGLVAALQQIEFLDITPDRAQVKVQIAIKVGKKGLIPEMQRSKKTSVPVINRNKVSAGILSLRKLNGQWQIYSMKNFKNQSLSSESAANAPRPSVKPVNNQVFRQVFVNHLAALNSENLNSYLATLDRTSPNYNATKIATQKLFKDYDLKYDMQSVAVLSQGPQEAVVKMVATVRKIKGGGFADSKMVTYNTLKRHGDQWQIYDTQIDKLTPLSPAKISSAKK